MTIGLLSDAGTPTISDPGYMLVAKLVEKEIPFTLIPGPSSVITALALSGLETERFQFLGFLQKKPGKKRKSIREALEYPGTSIIFESPYRIVSTLKEIAAIDPERRVAVARELTKKFEEVFHGTAQAAVEKWEKSPPKGEIVLLISGT